MSILYTAEIGKTDDGKWRVVLVRKRDDHHIAAEYPELFIVMDLARQLIEKSESE